VGSGGAARRAGRRRPELIRQAADGIAAEAARVVLGAATVAEIGA
jgi:hypothetical protein